MCTHLCDHIHNIIFCAPPPPPPQGIEVGPHLGLFKSSSLESLHNVMQHAIKRDIVDDGSDLRNRSTRNSFRRAVDRTIDGQRPDAQEGAGEQRGVDGEWKF